jgi:aminoglycoside phosphotransferase (APT) family kinase protein
VSSSNTRARDRRRRSLAVRVPGLIAAVRLAVAGDLPVDRLVALADPGRDNLDRLAPGEPIGDLDPVIGLEGTANSGRGPSDCRHWPGSGQGRAARYARLVPGLADQVLAWTAQAVAPGARITQVTGLRDSGNPWLLRLERAGRQYQAVLKTGDPVDARDRMQLRTQVAALAIAHDRDLPAPRVIAADLSGSQAGALAMVTSVLPGSTAIPRTMSAGRARSLGALAAAIHAVTLTPQPELPARTRPLPGVDFAAWRRSAGTTPLLARAEQQVSDLPKPDGATVLVHGDLWQGNTMWSAGACTGVIDWDCAGAGPPGIDLGYLRLDAALYHGPAAAEQVLDGWRQAAGREPEQVAYWDIVAALTTVGDMAQCMPPLPDHHRPDLNAHILTARRDAFLTAALARANA